MPRYNPAVPTITLFVVLFPGAFSHAEDIRGKLQRALELERSGRLEQSIEVYREILKENPQSAKAHTGLGRACFRSKQFPAAVASFEHALRLKPGDPEALGWLARSYLRAEEPEKALNLFARGPSDNENHAWVHVLRACAYDAQDKLDDATRGFQRALALDPQYPGAHFALGFISWTTRDFATAEKEYRAELALNPGYHLARYHLADLLMTQGKITEAEVLLKQMARHSSHSYLYHFEMGKLEQHRGNFPRAADEFREAIQFDPSQAEAHYRLAVMLRKLGRSEEAKQEFEEAQRLEAAARPQARQGMGQRRPRLPDLE